MRAKTYAMTETIMLLPKDERQKVKNKLKAVRKKEGLGKKIPLEAKRSDRTSQKDNILLRGDSVDIGGQEYKGILQVFGSDKNSAVHPGTLVKVVKDED